MKKLLVLSLALFLVLPVAASAVEEEVCVPDVELEITCPEPEPTPAPVPSNSASYLQYAPRMGNGYTAFLGRSLGVLGSSWGIMTVYMSPTSHQFPLNEWSRPFYPQSTNYGYEYSFTESQEAVYHTLVVPDYVPAGTYFVRFGLTGRTFIGTPFAEVLSQEFMVAF